MLHADGLCLRFALEGSLQIHIEFAIEHLFCLAECECWSTSQFFSESSCGGAQFCGGHDEIVETDSFSFGGTDEISRKQQLGGLRETNHTRQKIRRCHVCAGEPDFDKQKSYLCFFIRETNVSGKGDGRPRACGGAIQTCNHRLRQRANILNKFTRHAGELEQSFHVPAEQLTNNVVHVAARTERSAGASNYDNSNVRLVAQPSKRIRELPINFKRQRIKPLGTVQCDRRYALLVLFINKSCWLFHAGSTAMPSISTFAASSSSPATWTRTIVGKCLPMCFR